MQDTSPSSSRDHRMQDTAEPAWEFNGLIEEGRITVESAELSSLGGNAHYKDNSRNQDTTRNHNDNINCSSKHHKLEERCNETSSLSSFEEDDDNGDADDDFIKEDEEEKEVAVPLAFPTTNTAAVTAAAAVSHPHQRERKQPQQSKTKSNPKSEEQSADDLLVYELNQLSFQERNTINEEVHGTLGVTERQGFFLRFLFLLYFAFFCFWFGLVCYCFSILLIFISFRNRYRPRDYMVIVHRCVHWW